MENLLGPRGRTSDARRRSRAAFQLYNASVYRNVVGRTYTPGASGVVQKDRRGLQIFPLLEIEVQL